MPSTKPPEPICNLIGIIHYPLMLANIQTTPANSTQFCAKVGLIIIILSFLYHFVVLRKKSQSCLQHNKLYSL